MHQFGDADSEAHVFLLFWSAVLHRIERFSLFGCLGIQGLDVGPRRPNGEQVDHGRTQEEDGQKLLPGLGGFDCRFSHIDRIDEGLS